MKKILILIEKQFNDHEFWYPYYRLKEAGCEVVVAGNGEASYTGKYGTIAKPNALASEVAADDFDGILIPGGFAPDFMRRNAHMVELVRAMDSRRKLVATICHGGWMLASARILEGRTVTCHFAIAVDIENAGATLKDEEVVVDGNLVTSRTPDDLPAFMRTIVGMLEA